MAKLKPAIVVIIIGIIILVIGISLISIGTTTKLPVYDNKMQERQGSVSVDKTNSVMIAVGAGMTVVGLGMTVIGGLYAWRRRD